MSSERTNVRDLVGDFRQSWRPLLAAWFTWNVVALVVLTPLVVSLLHLLLVLSGPGALTDEEILLYVLRPAGLVVGVLIAALLIGLFAIGCGLMMTIGFAASHGKRVTLVESLWFLCRSGVGIVHVAARLVCAVLVTVAPFLVLGVLVAWSTLGEYDINFYLSQKPPEFRTAVWLIGIILLAMAAGLIVRGVNWLFALPLLLFEGVPARDALKASRTATAGARWRVAGWLAAWFGSTLLLGAVTTAAATAFGHWLIPRVSGSLFLVALAVGAVTLLITVGQLATAFVNASLLSLLTVRLFRRSGHGESLADVPVAFSEPPDGRAAQLLTRRRVAWALTFGVVAAAVVGVVAIRSLELEDSTFIVAHRGASAAAPENTLAAIEQAIDDGSDWVEIDVQETADGEVIVIHDTDLKRVGGASLRVGDSTLAQLQAVDVGSWFDPSFQMERLPTLDQVLKLCRGRAKVNIELKYHSSTRQLEQRVVDIVEANRMQDDIVLMSLKYPGLQRMRELRPTWKIGLLKSVSLGDTRQLDVDFFAINASFASRSVIRQLHKQDKEVLVWTVNDPVSMSVFMSRGVDGLITDEPALARDVLRERAEMSPPERLLLELAVWFGQTPRIGPQ